MPSDSEMDRGGSSRETLDYYKSQIEQLEAELLDFQQSSRELEQELEKELEASEKQHRDLKEKNEQLRYEVEEWKNKYKQAKVESNSAQSVLQKEITALRDTNRQLGMRLRDIEVANDDLEKQERINKSSLDDYESRYGQAIERAVMLEAEVQMGEQEREALRIETQRLKEELSDLKVEQEITQEKLANAQRVAGRSRRPNTYASSPPSGRSTSMSTSPTTPTTMSSVGSRSSHSIASATPPSPPISEASTTPSNSGHKDPATTPRPSHYQRVPTRHSRGPSIGGANSAIPLPQSRSLHQIRGLIGQMQRLEQRVQGVRSKLPQTSTPPSRISPGNTGLSYVPSTVTVRSHRRNARPSSTLSTSSVDTAMSGISRLSFGQPPSERPQSRTSYIPERPMSRTSISRPDSRTSNTSRTSLSHSNSSIPQRPLSRASTSGRATPLSLSLNESRVPRSARPSLSSAYPPPPLSANSTSSQSESDDVFNTTPVSRRNTLTKDGMGGIPVMRTPTPSMGGSGIPRRSFGPGRRSVGGEGEEMGPPGRVEGMQTLRKKRTVIGGPGTGGMRDLGETY